jgi:UDP-galactopyranose mutase
MTATISDIIIVGAGISGLACARCLQQCNKDFLIISKDIGGRILTSDDEKVNYGAFFVCSDYHNLLNFVKIKSRIKLNDFCFHDKNKTYVLFEPRLLPFLIQFIKIFKIQFKFRKALRKFRKTSETISQKNAIENDSFLKELYMKNATDFIKEKNIQIVTDTYLSKGLYSTTFSSINEMNAFSFLQFLLPLITPIYSFSFEKEKMIKPFK